MAMVLGMAVIFISPFQKLFSLLIDIIIPCLNEADNLAKLLPYLKKYAGNNIGQIFIADAGSTDATEAVSLQNEVAYINTGLRSRAKQMNAVAKISTASILYFIHADTLPPKTFETDILNAVEEGFKIGSYRTEFDSDSKLLKLNAYFTKFDMMVSRGGDQTLFILKEFFEELGAYREDYPVMEEYDLIRKARKVCTFKILDGATLISTRKYIENSYVRVNMANFIVFNAWRIGIHPNRLILWYKKLIKHPKV